MMRCQDARRLKIEEEVYEGFHQHVAEELARRPADAYDKRAHVARQAGDSLLLYTPPQAMTLERRDL